MALRGHNSLERELSKRVFSVYFSLEKGIEEGLMTEDWFKTYPNVNKFELRMEFSLQQKGDVDLDAAAKFVRRFFLNKNIRWIAEGQTSYKREG